MNKYRTHTCGELNIKNNGKEVLLSGWINKKRDHGNLLFLDLRDNYGITQCVVEKNNPNFIEIEKLPLETVIKINGKVIKRSEDTINREIKTGERLPHKIEVTTDFTYVGNEQFSMTGKGNYGFDAEKWNVK